MSNTPLHITRAQAESLLAAVHYEQGTRLANIALGHESFPESKARLSELAGNESMLLAALSRIGDLERKSKPHLRVATVGKPW